jgi:N utilization substance protein A
LSSELMQALNEIEKDRGIPKDALIDAIKSALNTAYKKNFGIAQSVNVHIDELSGEVKVFSQKKVVDEVSDERLEISIDEARELYPDCSQEDLVYVEITPSDFGRIAAQTAKQVVIQKLREAERSLIYEEFLDREGEIVTGTVQRVESKTVYVSLGRTEGIMLPPDQIAGERYEVGQRIKAYIYEVKNTSKGPNIFLSRSHPYFLRRLFELEVPEIYDGVVEIKSIAREAGARSKISVHSLEDKIDSVGACVGPYIFSISPVYKGFNNAFSRNCQTMHHILYRSHSRGVYFLQRPGFCSFGSIRLWSRTLCFFYISRIMTFITIDNFRFSAGGHNHKFVALVAPDGSAVGFHHPVLKIHSFKYPAIGFVHLFIGKIQSIFIYIEGIKVFHNEFPASHQAKARSDFIPVFILNLIQEQGQIPVRMHILLD